MTAPAFHTTRWSLVARTGATDAATAARALGELCELYWPPLYAFLRRGGHGEHDALDTVQAFCVHLLERGGLGGADAQAGAFRHYLLGALRHFVANRRRAAAAERRGGGVLPFALDGAEAGYAAEPAHGDSPERVFERRWAAALLARAHGRLRDEYAARGKGDLFARLEPALVVADDAMRHQDTAAALGTTEGAVKVALHRLRARMRELIRDEVLQTVSDPAAVDGELTALFAALGR
jgi:DNA-directed RNA polymerase specialized sigma24 family protein